MRAGQRERAAECPAEIVLPQRGFRLAEEIVKPVIGIEDVVAQVVEGRAMPLNGARLGHKGKLSAWIAPIFRGIRRALNAELLKRVNRDDCLRGSKYSRCSHGCTC